jgi:hypothetical protein
MHVLAWLAALVDSFESLPPLHTFFSGSDNDGTVLHISIRIFFSHSSALTVLTFCSCGDDAHVQPPLEEISVDKI